MRDYPSVPNVFRVASSHSVDTDPAVVAFGTSGDIKKANANLSIGQQLRQQKNQQKQKQQHQQNGNIGGQQPTLVKTSNSSASATKTPAVVTTANHATKATVTTSAKSATTVATSLASSPTSVLKTFANSNTTTNTNKDVDNIKMHNHDLQQQQLQQQKRHQQYTLTTHASIERPHRQYLDTAQLYLQQSPYATLPRHNNTTFALQSSSLTPHSLANSNDSDNNILHEPQQLKQTTLRHHNSGNSSSSNGHKTNPISTSTNNNSNNIVTTTSTVVAATTVANTNRHSLETKANSSPNENTMMGVINTISGSIPATGFPLDHGSSNNNTKSSGGLKAAQMVGGMNGRTMSVGSDLNGSMNNSCTNLSKLNGLSQQQQQQHQQQQQRYQQQQQQKLLQSTTGQQHDFRQGPTSAGNLDEFTPYRRPMAYPCTSTTERNNSGYLWIVTPVAASISVAIVIAALAGPQWLFTEEKQPNSNYNGTANFNVLDDGAFITRYTKSSLWIICSTVQGVETYNCIKIDYFSKEGYHPDPHDSASAIPYTVTKSCPFFLASGIVLLLSFIVFLIPTCSHQNNLYYFSAGIMFIVSGLLMLIGLIAYISILKAEIGSKLRPRSSLQPPMFKVTYGQSFFLFVFGFIATEFVGLLNIFLYISLQEVGYYSRLPCFSISNLQEKIREGENRHNYHKKNTYKSYKHEMDKKPIDRKRHSQQNKKHQVRAQELEVDTKKLLKNMSQMSRVEAVAAAASGRRIPTDIFDKFTDVPYACRKHPNGLGSTMYLNELERRYYFEKSTGQPGTLANKCYLHSKNLAKSLNELYLESTLPPPPPSTIRMGGAGGLQQQKQQRQQQLHQLQIQTLPRPPQQFSDPPQEFPLTRSVSTTTEIYATHHNVSFADDLSENQTAIATATAKSSNKTSSASQEQRNNGGNRRRNVATNTMYANNSDTETQTNVVDGNHHQQQQQQQQLYNTRKFLQQQQLQQQQLENLYNKRQQQQHQQLYVATSIASNRADGKNQHRLVHHGGDDDDARRRENANGDHHNGVEEDIDADEEQPQKLCGLRRGIRKTKDELFEEFCKRAGVRPKPKNIYYIENDDDVEEVDVADADASDERHKTSRSKNNNPRLLEAAPRKFHGNQSEFRVGSKSRENNRSYLAAGGVLDGNVTNGPNDDVGLTPNINGSRAGHDDDGDDAADSLLTATLGGNGGDHDDEDDDEHGFKKLTENEDHLYVIDDNIHLMPPSAAIRNGRRASMYVEPNHMRRLNSNLSLHALYAPLPVQNGLYDYESPTAATSSNYAGFATVPGTHYAMTRDVYGGSQNRLHQQHYHHADYHQQQQQQQQQQYQLQSMYQSRTTLPRTLVKRNADSQDSIASAVSASQLHNLYSSSGSQQRLTTLMMQHQQQQLQMQQNRYLSLSREQEVYNSRYGLHKSNEELNRQYIHPQQQQPIYLQMPHQMQYTQQPPPPQQSSTLKQQHQQPMVQWPTAIPSSPNSLRLYGGVGGGGGGGGAGGGIGGPSAAVVSSQNGNHAILTRSQSGGGNGTVGANGPSKFQRAYAFDEQRRPSVMVGDAFDLEEIERERRRSHASLFAGMTAMGGGGGGGSGGSPVMKTNGPALASVSIAVGGTGVGVMGPQKSNNTNRDHYDMINGTAV